MQTGRLQISEMVMVLRKQEPPGLREAVLLWNILEGIGTGTTCDNLEAVFSVAAFALEPASGQPSFLGGCVWPQCATDEMQSWTSWLGVYGRVLHRTHRWACADEAVQRA